MSALDTWYQELPFVSSQFPWSHNPALPTHPILVSFTAWGDVHAALHDVNELPPSPIVCWASPAVCSASSYAPFTHTPSQLPCVSFHFAYPFIIICTEMLIFCFLGAELVLTFAHPLSSLGVSKLLVKDKIHSRNWGQSKINNTWYRTVSSELHFGMVTGRENLYSNSLAKNAQNSLQAL